MDADSVSHLYRHRFDDRHRRRKDRVWQVLCRHFFQRYVDAGDTLLDLGAGSCEFVNHIRCARRIAVDSSPDLAEAAAPGVEAIVADAADLAPIADGSVDVVFASNFFEHLPTREAFLDTLREVRRVLRPGGRLLVLQPNIRVIGGSYWDFLDHRIPITDRTLAEAFALTGFTVVELRPRFLPYTTKSRLPQHPLLVRLYLAFPPAHLLLGGQAWAVAERR